MDQEYIDELKQLLDIAKHPKTQSLLQNALTELEKTSSKVEEHEQSETEQSETEQSSPEQTTPEQRKPEESKPESAKITQNCAAGKVIIKPREPSKNLIRISNYGWDQSDKYVKIYINDMTGAKTENVHAEFQTRNMKVEIWDVSGKNYTFSISSLYADIVPEQCTTKAKSGMVIISLRTKKSDKWQFLTAREKKLKDIKDHKAKLSDEDKSDPSKSIMGLMKQMYQDGDAEMKRTIAKSWQEAQDKRTRGDGDFDLS